MTTKLKIALGVAAAAVGVGAYVYLRKKPKSGNVIIGELNVAGCDCFRYEYLTDGTTRTTKVDRQLCVDDGLGPDLEAACKQNTPGSSWLPTWLGGVA